jgi:hypothetical protein
MVADRGLAVHFNSDHDSDPAPHQSDANLRPLVFMDSILSLHASIVSVQVPPRLHFESLKLLNFDLMRIRIQLFTLVRIRIQLPKIMRIRTYNPDFNCT